MKLTYFLSGFFNHDNKKKHGMNFLYGEELTNDFAFLPLPG